MALAWEGNLIVLQDLLRPVSCSPRRRPPSRCCSSCAASTSASPSWSTSTAPCRAWSPSRTWSRSWWARCSASTREAALIEREPDGTSWCAARSPLREIPRELGLGLEEPARRHHPGRPVRQLAGGIPNRGARLAANDGLALEVLDATPRVVRRVRLLPPPLTPALVFVAETRELTDWGSAGRAPIAKGAALYRIPVPCKDLSRLQPCFSSLAAFVDHPS